MMIHLRGAICGRCPALVTRLNRTPTPSKTPRRIPHMMAELRAVRGPPYSINMIRTTKRIGDQNKHTP